MPAVTAYIGMGSNLHNPLLQMRRAADALAQIPEINVLLRSPLYTSTPLGPADQPDYLNAVVALETALPAEKLLDALQAIEHKQGRTRQVHWGPRTLDLDILLYGDRIQKSARLTLPHPHLQDRAFVLYPLQDIAPTLQIPGLGSLQTLLDHCPPLLLKRLTDDW